MNEIIVIHIGKCGNNLSTKFWGGLCERHGLDPQGHYVGHNSQQLERINVFFNGIAPKFQARAVLIDLEPGVLYTNRASLYGELFPPHNYIFAQNGAGHNWAKGYYTEGAALIDQALEVIRTEAESCQSLQGFIVVHSLSGGTSGGMGSLIMAQLREAYPDKLIATFSVFPSSKDSEAVEAYNAMLTMQHLVTDADLVFCLDNEALSNICLNSLKIDSPVIADSNHLIAAAFSSVTAPLGLPSPAPNDFATLADLVKNLVPAADPRLHFLTIALAPVTARGLPSLIKLTEQELAEQLLAARNSLTSARGLGQGKNLAGLAVLHGPLAVKEIHEQISHAVVWAGNNLSTIRFAMPPQDANLVGTLISNSTTIQALFERIDGLFKPPFTRKQFLHWYTGEGMDEMEFIGAEEALNDLRVAYLDAENTDSAFV